MLPPSRDGTWSDQLDELGAKLLGPRFLGTYRDRDFKQSTLKPGEFALVNIDEHWIALVKLDNKRHLMYDSFGRKLALRHVRKGDIMSTDPDPEQRRSETNCGQRALAFIILYVVRGLGAALLI